MDILNEEQIQKARDGVKDFTIKYPQSKAIARAQYDHMVEQGWVKWDSEKVARYFCDECDTEWSSDSLNCVDCTYGGNKAAVLLAVLKEG